MPREPAALLVASARGRESWLLTSLLGHVIETQDSSVRVEWAETVQKAMDKLKERPWHACLVDEQIAGETGLELVRQARARGVTVPMVLCMAREDATLEDIALEAGAAEVVPLESASPRTLGKLLHRAMVRGRVESRVRTGGDHFQRMFEASPHALSLTTLEEGRFIEVNPTFCGLLGYTRDEVVGRTEQELGLWSEERGRNTMRARLRASGTLEGMEALLQRRDGRLVHALTTARIVKVDNRQCVLATTTDITGSRRAEVELLRRESQLETVEQAAGWGSWDYDIPTASMAWSPNLRRMLQLHDLPRTLDGYLQRVVEDDRGPLAEAFWRAAARGVPFRAQHRVQLPDGRVMGMEMSGMPEFDFQDEPLFIFGTLHPMDPVRPKPAGKPEASREGSRDTAGRDEARQDARQDTRPSRDARDASGREGGGRDGPGRDAKEEAPRESVARTRPKAKAAE